MGSRLHNAPIVIDNGSGTIRAGFAGEDVPKCYFPSYVGRPKHVRTMAGALEGDVFIGPQAQQYRGLFKINYPLEHGIVTDWDDMERIWQYVYHEGLKTVSEDHPVLLTEPPLNPRENRDVAAQILFETFNVPALYSSVQAVLSLYASGKTTGLVLDSGNTQQHTADRRGGARCHRALPAAAAEKRADIPHKRREGDGQEHQRGNRLRRARPGEGGEGVVWSSPVRGQERRLHTTRRAEAEGEHAIHYLV
jgi:hypothetical protein